jgi:hypothetical protein
LVWALWHRGIEQNEIANELTITGSGEPLTRPELAKGSSDRTPHRPEGQGDLEDSTVPHLYRTMHRGSVENSLMKTRMLLNRNQLRQVTPYLTGQLFTIGYHPKKAVVTMSIETV